MAEITRLQDKCPYCGKIAKSIKETTYPDNSGPDKPDLRYISLDCGHLIVRKIPHASDFGSLLSSDQKKLYPFQIEGARFIEEALAINNGAGLFDEMGLGKVQALETPILTVNGWKKNGDLKIGDLVIASDGNAYPVTEIFPQGLIDLYKVTFSDGSTTNCGDEHLWIVNTSIRKWRNQPNLVKPFKELKNDLYLTAANSSNKLNSKWYIPVAKAINFNPRKVEIDSYQLGILLGDGCLTQHQISFCTNDIEIKSIFHIVREKDNDYFLDNSYLVRIRILGLEGCKSNSKFIPENYKFNTIEIRLAILQGLMDTDGSIWNNGVVEYTTVSSNLAKDVLFLVESLGGTVRLTSKEEPKYTYKGETLIGQKAYRLVINIPVCPFRLERKASQWHKRYNNKKYDPTRAIIGYEYIGKKEGQCIAIASPDNSYLTENCIVTHNTPQSLAYLKFHPEAFPVLFILKSGIKFQWAKEILRWLDDSYVPQVIETSKDYVLPQLKSYIASFDIFTPKTRTIRGKTVNQGFDYNKFVERGIKTIVIDECQQIKNPDASRTHQIRKLIRDTGARVIALSGTPWKNRGSEFYTILNILAPQKFPTYQGFLNKWVDYYYHGNQMKMGGIRDIPKFREYIKDIAIRREIFEVMSELPDVNRTLHYTELDTIEQKEYDASVSEFVAWYNDAVIGGEEDSLNSLNILAKMQKMRHITGLAKIPATEEFVDEFVEETERKITVFVHHQDVGSILYDSFKKKYEPDIPVFQLTSALSSIERFEVQEKFNNSTRAILIASTLASGEGINLQTCSDAIMHERQWNPQNEDQAAPGRFRRIGQEAKQVNVTFMTASGTIDEYLANMVETKREQFHATMNKGESVSWNQTNIASDLASAIASDWNRKNKNEQISILKKMASL